MDEQKKQKVLLALVVVLVLGAGGSYWFFVRDSGGAADRVIKSGPVQRKTRTKVTTAKPQRNRRRVERDGPDVRTAQRRERNTEKRAGTERRKHGRKQKKVKKQKLQPAA